MSGELETARLRLRPCASTDVDCLHGLFELPQIRRYLFDDRKVERAWVESAIEDSRRLFESSGYGLFVVSLREEPDRVLGFTGFREFFDPPQLQLLYGLHPEVWGRGFATEMAREMVERAFDDFGLEEVIAAADRPNKASFEVMERVGLEPWKETDEGLWGTIYYRLTRT